MKTIIDTTIIVIAVVLVTVIFLSLANANEPEPSTDFVAISEVEQWIGYYLHYRPKHFYRAVEYAPIIVDTIKKYGIQRSDTHLVVSTIITLESAWLYDAIGFKLQEQGLMQVHGRCARGFDLSTPRGQIEAGVNCFRICLETCNNNLEQAINKYGTGYCRPIRSFVARRLRLYRKIVKRVRGM
jgi:hypothetical protein